MSRSAFIGIILVASVSYASESYLWPLSTERKLSSSFAESRESNYHAGIDLRTFGRVGLPCLASDDCEAVRLRVHPSGYGKALYLVNSEGYTFVYAHLQGFCRPLDSIAYNWRLDRRRNSCDIEIPRGTFRFRKGDVVGFTGSTGSLHPHLHFEVRSPDGCPINPLESFFYAPDSVAPIAQGLAVVPLLWGSLVNGSPLARTIRFRFLGNDSYALDDTLELSGRFGFAVQAYDKQELGSYKMGWYYTELKVDGKTIYRLRNTRFDYAQARDVGIEYERLSGEQPGRYMVMFRKPANMMPDREGIGAVSTIDGSEGAVFLEPGLHRGEIILKDVQGNSAICFFHFFAAGAPDIRPMDLSAADAIRQDSFSCSFTHELGARGLYLFINTKTDCPMPAVDLLGDTTSSSLRVFRLGPGRFVTLADPQRFLAGANTFRVRFKGAGGQEFERFKSFPIAAFESGSRHSFDISEGFTVSIETPSVRGVSLMIVGGNRNTGNTETGLVPVSVPFDIECVPEQLASYPRLTFPGGPGDGLYIEEQGEMWAYVGSMKDPGGAPLRKLGTYAIMKDIAPPLIRGLASTLKCSPSGYFKRRCYYVSVTERESGIDAESVEAYINGSRVVCEWDGYRRRVFVPVPNSYPTGMARFSIKVEDRSGNRASAEYNVMIK